MVCKDIADTKIKSKILINHCILGLIINNLSGKNIIQKVPKSWRNNEKKLYLDGGEKEWSRMGNVFGWGR